VSERKDQTVLEYTPTDNSHGIATIRKKGLLHAYHVVNLDTASVCIDVRTYVGRSSGSSTIYAVAWIHGSGYGEGTWGIGSGKAGGYGYHKESAAISEALGSAGVKLELPIAGSGETAVREALGALAVHLGAFRYLIVESYA